MDKFLSGRRVLVVEDEMLVLIMIEDMLTDLGCVSIATAATVDTAIALIAAQDFDVAMLDMNLNGSKTFAVADVLGARSVPFVFATGYSAPDMRGGYSDYPVLKKPFSDGELAEILARLLTG